MLTCATRPNVARTDRALSAYVSAAAAAFAIAGISPGDAGATIIYTAPPGGIPIGQGFSQSVDLDSNGFNDIQLKNYVFSGGNYMGATVLFAPGKLVGFNVGSLAYVSNMGFGSLIDASTVGPSFFGSMAYGAVNPNAQFNNAANGYIGLSFPDATNTYYGWLRVSVNQAAGTFVIQDWAYDNSGAGIGAGVVPEPAALGLLAVGAAGLAAYRRRT